ncbi:tRNA (adenosine(37)-N6)-threonylcarbamoyltransferase complex dimerization subunit type 1 TsaB [Fodinibius sp.]|uniref:tRNA (adenosine(37)-N6)-threonylcarbamoyltransferase complex dimerization subunit type 1 TsaB n=1 Tax=Fodinibius sp. TaxID=1872440 RepID=UPI002ACE7773|nr:tRNA (adenosine(37)-N6)-threonylcarbamoyltransferase complex dimerization subunit type 1 TsaB [Fodinibius sp.]MDZ7658471.1 tRNA (adenosine(37)-N6)-threonylcarbamoyltransferase complex dimerization subunit type 1 TsaB [Fodinibius sp.]
METATKVCSVAYCDENRNVYEQRTNKRGTHSEQLFLFIEQLQNEHDFEIKDLDAVLVSEGPGSYTGLRISASAVKGLLFQTEVPLMGINTLASFAMQATRENPKVNRIHSIIDARRVHVYHQQFVFADGNLSTEDEVEVIPIKAFEKMLRKDDVVIGTGLDRIDQQVLSKTGTFGIDLITARSLISLYQAGFSDFYKQDNPELFEPKYYASNQVN